MRTLSQIAAEIRHDWKKVNFAAKPYLDAMVIYFLSNATTWRGEKAKAIKSELKKLIK